RGEGDRKSRRHMASHGAHTGRNRGRRAQISETNAEIESSLSKQKHPYNLMKKLAVALLIATIAASLQAEDKKILLIAGKPSHGPGDHEFNAGCLLLEKALNEIPGISAETHNNGWPESDAAFEGADAILIYADGGQGHPA